VELESDVQHVEGRVIFFPVGIYWEIPMAVANVNSIGKALLAAVIGASDSTTQLISVTDDVAEKFAIFTGLTCVWDSVNRAVRVYTPGGNVSDLLKNEAGYELTTLEGIDWGVQYLTPPDVTFVLGTPTPLRPLDSSSAVYAFRSRFSGLTFPESDLRRPVAYNVRTEHSGTRTPSLSLDLAPAAEYASGSGSQNEPWELQADVFLEPPRFSCCDVASGTRLPVPHRYAESLVIPLARYYALSARYRVQESTVAFVKEQAAQALALIGEVDPRAKEVQENRKPSQ